MMTSRVRLFLMAAAMAVLAPLDLAQADAASDCEGALDLNVRVAACTSFISTAGSNGISSEILATAHTIRGLARQDLGQADGALADFDASIRLVPSEGIYHYNRGQLLLQAKQDNSGAIAAFDRALALNPNFHPAYTNKGMALLYMGKANDALDSFSQALKIDPKSTVAHANTGWAYEILGKRQEAIDAYKRAVAIDPGMRAAISSFSKIDPGKW